MRDCKGDPDKKPPECTSDTRCPNIEEVGGGFEGEIYDCAVCGEHFTLWYEDMA